MCRATGHRDATGEMVGRASKAIPASGPKEASAARCTTEHSAYNLAVGSALHARDALGKAERDTQRQLARCVFGHIFRPIPIAPSWLRLTVVASLTQAAYSSSASSRPGSG